MNLRYRIYDLRAAGAGDGCGMFHGSGASESGAEAAALQTLRVCQAAGNRQGVWLTMSTRAGRCEPHWHALRRRLLDAADHPLFSIRPAGGGVAY